MDRACTADRSSESMLMSKFPRPGEGGGHHASIQKATLSSARLHPTASDDMTISHGSCTNASRGARLHPCMGICWPELIQQRLMCQKIDILGVIIGFVASLCLLLRLSGRDPFQDAKPPAKTRSLTRKDFAQAPGPDKCCSCLKSESLSCNFFKAWFRVTYCTALPLKPCAYYRVGSRQISSSLRKFSDSSFTCFSFLPILLQAAALD